MIKTLALASLALCLVGAPTLAFAEDACMTQLAAKPLSGAAKTSFLKKCETTACEAKAAAMDKPLAGAAKTSFVKKCVADAMKM